MIKIHLRDGGSKFSLIYAKYLVRKVLAPLVRVRRARMLEKKD